MGLCCRITGVSRPSALGLFSLLVPGLGRSHVQGNSTQHFLGMIAQTDRILLRQVCFNRASVVLPSLENLLHAALDEVVQSHADLDPAAEKPSKSLA
ncbi:hypothetical protein D3C80_1830080 [compost metagenome]